MDTSDPVIDKLLSFSNVQVDWNYIKVGPLSVGYILSAISLYEKIKDFDLVCKVELSFPDNKILLTFGKENHFIKLRLWENKSIDFTYNVGNELVHIEVDRYIDIPQHKIRYKLWELHHLHTFSEIKPCPFCGNAARLVPWEDSSGDKAPRIYYMIGCTTPNCFGERDTDSMYWGPEYAQVIVDMWNTRNGKHT